MDESERDQYDTEMDEYDIEMNWKEAERELEILVNKTLPKYARSKGWNNRKTSYWIMRMIFAFTVAQSLDYQYWFMIWSQHIIVVVARLLLAYRFIAGNAILLCIEQDYSFIENILCWLLLQQCVAQSLLDFNIYLVKSCGIGKRQYNKIRTYWQTINKNVFFNRLNIFYSYEKVTDGYNKATQWIITTKSLIEWPNGNKELIRSTNFNVVYSVALQLASLDTRKNLEFCKLYDCKNKYNVADGRLNVKLGGDGHRKRNGDEALVVVTNLTDAKGGALSQTLSYLNQYSDDKEDKKGMYSTMQHPCRQWTWLKICGFPDILSKILYYVDGDQIVDGKSYALLLSCGSARSRNKYLLTNATKKEMVLWPKYTFPISYTANRYLFEWKSVVNWIKDLKKYKDLDVNNIDFTEDKQLINSIKYYGKMIHGRYGDYNSYANVICMPPCGLHIFRIPFIFFKYLCASVSSWIVKERNEWIENYKQENKHLKLSDKEIELKVPVHLLSEKDLEIHWNEHCEFDISLDIEGISGSKVDYVGGQDVKNIYRNRHRFILCDQCNFVAYKGRDNKTTDIYEDYVDSIYYFWFLINPWYIYDWHTFEQWINANMNSKTYKWITIYYKFKSIYKHIIGLQYWSRKLCIGFDMGPFWLNKAFAERKAIRLATGGDNTETVNKDVKELNVSVSINFMDRAKTAETGGSKTLDDVCKHRVYRRDIMNKEGDISTVCKRSINRLNNKSKDMQTAYIELDKKHWDVLKEINIEKALEEDTFSEHTPSLNMDRFGRSKLKSKKYDEMKEIIKISYFESKEEEIELNFYVAGKTFIRFNKSSIVIFLNLKICGNIHFIRVEIKPWQITEIALDPTTNDAVFFVRYVKANKIQIQMLNKKGEKKWKPLEYDDDNIKLIQQKSIWRFRSSVCDLTQINTILNKHEYLLDRMVSSDILLAKKTTSNIEECKTLKKEWKRSHFVWFEDHSLIHSLIINERELIFSNTFKTICHECGRTYSIFAGHHRCLGDRPDVDNVITERIKLLMNGQYKLLPTGEDPMSAKEFKYEDLEIGLLIWLIRIFVWILVGGQYAKYEMKLDDKETVDVEIFCKGIIEQKQFVEKKYNKPLDWKLILDHLSYLVCFKQGDLQNIYYKMKRNPKAILSKKQFIDSLHKYMINNELIK